ncbi:MAG: DUF1460 domain-containing protein [Ignavibacteriae bacterium]|nr:MAG: DUF1460 domain-containing protein [Ignavibacteriota bacterium]
MTTRRQFIQTSMMTSIIPFIPSSVWGMAPVVDHATILNAVFANHWEKLPIGELMGKIGQLFLGTPYVGGTLEGDGPEVCRVRYDGVDCVTFFETVLALARTIRSECRGESYVIAEVTRTRYRHGVVDGYLSRLHYTSDWIRDNITKKTVTDITEGDPLAEVFPVHVYFMSEHPQYYAPLKSDPTLVAAVTQIEVDLNAIRRWYVPKARVKSFESKLRTGDIVAITTAKAGLDYSHTGMILVDEQGVARLMHASTTKKRVVIDASISEYLASVSAHTGITVVRPLEPDTSCFGRVD